MNDEFYIGWQSTAPLMTGRTIRRIIIALTLSMTLMAGLLAVAQRTIGVAVFEWGDEKHFSGIFRAWPYPHLLVIRPNGIGKPLTFSTYFLVAPLKFGLSPENIAKFDGKFVTLQGALLYRGDHTMIEVTSSSIAMDKKKSVAVPLAQAIPLGKQTFTGEIVDSKCFFGAMNPGQLAPHRACAILCISGGIPPILVVWQKNRPPVYLLLASAAGKAVNQQILNWVAEPVEITGELECQDGLLVLCADPATYRHAVN